MSEMTVMGKSPAAGLRGDCDRRRLRDNLSVAATFCITLWLLLAPEHWYLGNFSQLTETKVHLGQLTAVSAVIAAHILSTHRNGHPLSFVASATAAVSSWIVATLALGNGIPIKVVAAAIANLPAAIAIVGSLLPRPNSKTVDFSALAIGLATMLLIILIDGTGASGFLTDAIGRDAYLGLGPWL